MSCKIKWFLRPSWSLGWDHVTLLLVTYLRFWWRGRSGVGTLCKIGNVVINRIWTRIVAWIWIWYGVKCFVQYSRTRCFCIRNRRSETAGVNSVRQHFPWNILFVKDSIKITIKYMLAIFSCDWNEIQFSYWRSKIVSMKFSDDIHIVLICKQSCWASHMLARYWLRLYPVSRWAFISFPVMLNLS